MIKRKNRCVRLVHDGKAVVLWQYPDGEWKLYRDPGVEGFLDVDSDCVTWRTTDRTPLVSAVWGDWSFDPVMPPMPTPEPSPADKAMDRALEEFEAKRKAKRDRSNQEVVDDAKAWRDSYPQRKAEADRADALDRAMSKLAPHHHNIHERLMPYRVAL